MEEKKRRRYSEAQNKATQRYLKKNYDEVRFRIRKDGDLQKADIMAAAAAAGESLNQYMIEATRQRMARENRTEL